MVEEQTQEVIMNVADEVLRIAAPKQHTHNNATQSKNGYMSSEDKEKLDGISPNADKTNIIIDSSLPDNTTSTNPVQAKVIMQKIKDIKNTIITISNTLDPSSTNHAVSGQGISQYVEEKISESEEGTAKSPLDAGAFTSLDSIIDNGVYYIGQNPTNITCGNETVNIHGGYMYVKNAINIQTQNVIAENGVEYSRWKNNSATNWSNWKVYYMPKRQYTKPITVNDYVFNFEVMEDTKGYHIKWNQGLSQDRNYFITHKDANTWKHVALFEPALQIDGCYIFGNNNGNFDIMITGGHYDAGYEQPFTSGLYIRSPNGNERLKGINYSYFVPRNN